MSSAGILPAVARASRPRRCGSFEGLFARSGGRCHCGGRDARRDSRRDGGATFGGEGADDVVVVGLEMGVLDVGGGDLEAV